MERCLDSYLIHNSLKLLAMFPSVAYSCVRNGSRLSVRVAGFSQNSTFRTSYEAVKKPELPQRPRAHSWFLVPKLRLVPGAAPARALSLPAAGAPEKAQPHEADPEEGFGSLSATFSSRRSYRKSNPDLEDLRYPEDEGEEQGLVRKPQRKNTPYWYFLQCKKLIKENKLQEALDMFGFDMLKGERLQPEEYNYSVLIGGCGRAGQLKKAFRLYNDMKKRGLEASDATYTALFNACAEAPSKPAGLQYALKLEQELCRKNYALSTITYHALLKAHAVTNHLQACLHTLREMLQSGHVVTHETFHYLLMGCVKERETGFRLALQIWRQMLNSNILPDSKNYNLLLRAARDCGIGDSALASAVLLRPMEDHKRETIDIDVLERQLFIQSDPHSDCQPSPESLNRHDSALMTITSHHTKLPPDNLAQNSHAPNLLDVFEGKSGGVVSLCAADGVSDRLALIGGASGFLQNMDARGLKPDLKTLTLLADMTEPSQHSLQMLLKVAKQHQVKLDTAFFNSVIRRSAKAGDLETAQGVLSVMRQRNVSVDVQTFGSLALGCEQKKDGLQLLNHMEESGFRPNVHVFSALIGRAARRLDYVYLKMLLQLMKDKEVWPNKVIIRQLEFASQYPPNYDQYKKRNNYLVHIDGFRGYYQHWLRTMPAQTDEQTPQEMQTQEAAVVESEAADGLTAALMNQRAAARRYHSKRKKTSDAASAL